MSSAFPAKGLSALTSHTGQVQEVCCRQYSCRVWPVPGCSPFTYTTSGPLEDCQSFSKVGRASHSSLQSAGPPGPQGTIMICGGKRWYVLYMYVCMWYVCMYVCICMNVAQAKGCAVELLMPMPTQCLKTPPVERGEVKTTCSSSCLHSGH